MLQRLIEVAQLPGAFWLNVYPVQILMVPETGIAVGAQLYRIS